MTKSSTYSERDRVLFRTDYFGRTWTWLRRFFAMTLLGLLAFGFPLDPDLRFLKPIMAGTVALYLLIKPKDDLVVTDKSLYHVQKSILTLFSRIDRYDISKITSIRCAGIHSDGWELVDVFNGGGRTGGYNTVEMTFADGSSKSLDLPIDRKALNEIVKIVYDLRREQSTKKQ